MRNHSYENDFDLHENETACRTRFHMKGFALRLVLKQRHKRTRKWPIKFKHEDLYQIIENTTTVTAPYYPISSLLSVSARLREVENKRKFQTFSSKSGRGRLREMVSYKRFPV